MQHYCLAKVMLPYSGGKNQVGLLAALCFVGAFTAVVKANIFDSPFNLTMYL